MQKQFENKLQVLKHDFDKLIVTVESLSHENLNMPMRQGKWSIAQTIYHVNLSFAGTIAYISKKIQYPDSLEEKKIAAWFRSVWLTMVLRSAFKVKAPEGVNKVPENISFHELKNQWNMHYRNLEILLENFPPALTNKNVFKNPLAGRITMYQTLSFLHEHTLHHIRQVEQYMKKKIAA
ncbi:MAG: DinB family protein [Chitinophagales bacterium]|nr:DinB family protein [Chitinophagales bacterium]